MPNSSYISVLVFIGALVLGTALLAQGTPVPQGFFSSLSPVVTALMLMLSAFDLWIWRWPLINRFVKRPDISGTWQAHLRSSWIDPGTQQTAATITSAMVIHQTYTTINVRLLTAESASQQLGASLARTEDGRYQLSGVYRNEPKVTVRDRSRMHFGAFLLDVGDSARQSLEGEYWTDRGTCGEMSARKRVRKKLTTFDEAIAALSAGQR
jgi:hypothetical protein